MLPRALVIDLDISISADQGQSRAYAESPPWTCDYPQDAQPNAFYSRTTLRWLASALDAGPGRMVVDLGCGHGRPSLWVAQQTGANLIGIDLSPVGIELAERRAAELG